MEPYVEIDSTECLNNNFLILKIFGFWLPERFRGSYMEPLYKAYSLFMRTSLFYLYFASELINIYKVFGDMEAVIESCFLTLTHAAEFVKLYIILRYRSDIKEILDKFNEPAFKRIHKESEKSVRAAMWESRRNTIVLQGSATATCVLWAIFPYLEEKKHWTLPLRGWYPYSTKVSPNFQLTFAYQITGAYTNALCICAMDLIASGLMALCSVQFQVLCDLINRTPAKKNFCEFTDHDSDGKTNCCEIMDCNDSKHLKGVIRRHQALIRLVEKFEAVFKVSAIVQFAVDCMIMGVTAFKIMLTPFSLEFISMVLYMNCMLVELLLYCYYGNDLMLMSVRVQDAAYECDWHLMGAAERKLLLMIMLRAGRPVAVTAGKIFKLSLPTFTSIIRISYSYFAVLQCVYQEN